MTDRRLPETVDALIDMLDEAFPDKCPDPTQDDRHIWMDVGSRRVVAHLRALQSDRDDNLMEQT